MGNLGPYIAARIQLQSPFIRRQHPVDSYIPIGVAIQPDPRAVYPLDPPIESS
jgi:hypothetical protein